MDANTKNQLIGMLVLAVGVLGAWLYSKFKKKVGVIETPLPKVYDRGKGVIRYNDGSEARKDCFKLWDSQKQKHVYTVPYPNFEADEGKTVAYEIEQGKDYGATIEVVEL